MQNRRSPYMKVRIVVGLALVVGYCIASPSRGTQNVLPSLGAVPSTESSISRFADIKIQRSRGARPTQLVLSDYLPPVGNQKSQGSCVGWSTAYYAYTFAVAKQLGIGIDKLQTPEWQFSYRYIWNQGNGGNNQGMTISKAMEILRDQGCCTLKEMPVDYSDTSERPSQVAVGRAKKYVAQSIGSLISRQRTSDVESLKIYLSDMKSPIVAGIPIYWQEFPKAGVTPDYVYRRGSQERPDGYHAVTIIGYDDDKRAFRIINSWGNAWGDNGQLWVDESFVVNQCSEAWGFVAGGPKTRSVLPPTVKFVSRSNKS